MKGRKHLVFFISLILGVVVLQYSIFTPNSVCARSFRTSIPTVVDPGYEVQILIPGCNFHGIHGITFDNQDNLYAGSVVGQSTYHVDTNTGDVKVFIGPPNGMADDLEFGPDGRVYYTSFLLGKLHCKGADGKAVVLAEGLPGINSLAFNKEGRLFATQVFMGDALYEIDLTGGKKTRKIADPLGGLNGFDFGPDNKLYGPLWFKKVIARVDVETGQVETIATGFKTPAAVNFDSKGNLYVVDTAAGEVIQVDVKTGQKTLIAKVHPAIDNLAVDSKDRIFITNMARNGIYEIDKKTGKARTVVEGKLSCANGVAVSTGQDGDTLYLANVFSYAVADGFTGEISYLAGAHAEGLQIHYPVTVSVHGNEVLLIGTSTGTVQIIDRLTNQEKTTFHRFKSPGHALMMDDGSLLVTEMDTGKIINARGKRGRERKVIAEGLASPAYLAMDGNEVVYVTEMVKGAVTRVNLASGEKKTIASGLRVPAGIAVLPDGKLVVVEVGTRQLVKINPSSGTVTPMVTNLAVGFPPGGPPALMPGVAASKSGAIYVAGDIENVIYKITPK
ncbi:MAG: SMP-30/gluconolactonase/LRE family protein [Deltaproteobacteria bacterium]|nr:SMP-30/gluconolactonase/LRE family protein [Deltaproteobacteria bacterium]MBW2051938.1 SMP-30/gluconolactonase/LRE family protein [Deltaproteobacteria bacterium]MBW2139893.1 SMP-30/gluconolactonase/LRE family protein [Deltaproteobacteria bacterium]MBW2322479.1 SMP-30/gluconolactonase/LRE family protein [Deltaproteobacteria bacterium]